MSVRARARTAWRRVVTLLLLPGRIVEELAHAAVIYWWAEALALVVEPETGAAAVHADAPDAPDWGLWLAAYAPMLVGIGAAVVLAGVVAVTGRWPSGTGEWVAVMLAALWWGRLVVPSESDREVVEK